MTGHAAPIMKQKVKAGSVVSNYCLNDRKGISQLRESEDMLRVIERSDSLNRTH
jgi:hypothetical protein